MKTVYKTIKVDNNNTLTINKKEIMKLEISHDTFRDNIINSLKSQLTKYPSDKKRVNYLLDNDFDIIRNENNIQLSNKKVSIYLSTVTNAITAIIQ